MAIVNYINDSMRITGNITIIDLAVQHADNNKMKLKVKIDWFFDINIVRICKGIILPFKLVRVDSKLIMNIYWNEKEFLSVY